MTENEKYIEIIKSLDCENITSITCDYNKTGCSDCNFMLAKNKAIQALEEIQQYRAIGTVEGYERAIQSSIENYNLYREYKAKVQEFEAIGTIDEFKTLKEKATPKEPIIIDNRLYEVEWRCPVCGLNVIEEPPCQEYCQKCGNKLDWS